MTTGIIAIAILTLLAITVAGFFLLLRLTDDLFEDMGGGKRRRFPDSPDDFCQDDFHAAMQRQIAREKGINKGRGQ
ncbi:MAG: hypothetical protein KBT70_18555 [Roseovarius sp.]|uniref:hypothetical protein n=1 Tax=Roseovarius sp. TaxID=1486281 RepID=UPI001B437C0E|nr:hypothetical protein [Roseovarius sp.]MBQ0752200.1 hypothetical protein [Roseovarius sp.]MBQ0812094.1 hypothetical protein [Roseovarius sp.]